MNGQGAHANLSPNESARPETETVFARLGRWQHLAAEHQIDFPIVYTIAREGKATLDPNEPGVDMEPLFQTLLDTVPAPEHDPDHPMRAWVTNLDASPYVGRLAVCRVEHGTIRKGQAIAWCRADGTTSCPGSWPAWTPWRRRRAGRRSTA